MSDLTIADAAASGALDRYDGNDAAQPADGTTPDGQSAAPDFTGKGYLLEEPDPKLVCRKVERLWKAWDRRMKPLVAQWQANAYTVEGVAGVRVVYDATMGGWYARVPLGASAVRVGLSKARELATKVTATLLVDPPYPDCEPSPDDDGDRAKAELSTRILKDDCGESGGVNLHQRLEDASNVAGLYTGSGFLLFDVDPCGGGWTPLMVDAHPAATRYDPAQPGAETQPPPDVLAGLDPDAQAEMATQPLVPKYAAPQGEDGAHPLTDDPTQAAKRWQLAVRCRLISARQVRLYPMTAPDIDHADLTIVAEAVPFGTLRGMFPAIDTMSQEDQLKLLKPPAGITLKDVLPEGVTVDQDGQVTEDAGKRQGYPADEAMVVTLTVYAKSHAAYPEGARVLCAGGAFVLHKDTQTVWVGEGEGTDQQRPECLDIPIAQVIRHRDPRGGNPCHIADTQLLSPGEDIRGQLLVDAVDTIYRRNRPNVFLPLGSVVQGGQLEVRDGTAIAYNAEAGQPVYEQMPGLDPETLALYEAQGTEMDSYIGLRETAQNLSAANITSGKQADTIQEQALTTLSPLNRHINNAFTRSCRILLQLRRAFATQPQLLRYTGEDGRYQVREWLNTDLGSTRDIRVQRGTSTMLSRSAKQGLASQELTTALEAATAAMDPEAAKAAYRRFQAALASNVDPILGRDQDEHHKRVLRQIHAWREGAKEAGENPAPALPAPMAPAPPMPGPMAPADSGAFGGAQPPNPTPGNGMGSLQQGPPQVDPTTGQPMMQGPQPDPAALACFEPSPVDAQPDVARTRALALGEELARESTDSVPSGWRLALDAAWDKARRDAGIVTVAEQQMAQRQAQAMQQQQAQAQLAQQSDEKQKDRDAAADQQTAANAARQAPPPGAMAA